MLAVALNETGTDIGVVFFQRLHDFIEADVVGKHLVRIRRDVEFLLKTTDGVDLDHAGDVAELGLDDPVLNGA